jgi:hypothetical protein
VPSTEFRRQAVLDRFAKSLVRLEEIVDPCHPSDSGSLASGRLSTVLGLDLATAKGGRKKTNQQGSRELIFRMVAENPTWGAPRIHGELLKLGFNVSERTVSRWVKRATRNPDPARRWLVFLRNHREAIAAMDFFTVPTLTFGVLYCFFVIGHDRRKILHCNVTRQPNALWIVLQLREAWGFEQPQRFFIFGRDARFEAPPTTCRLLLLRPER